MSRASLPLPLALAAAALLGAAAAAQQRDWSKIEIKTHAVAPGISFLEGAGGNIGVLAGPDGVLLIDDQFAPLTEKIKAAVARLSDRPIRFLLNTHHHGDHTGGNENLGKAGVLIVAHDNVRRRLSNEQKSATTGQVTPPLPKEAWPVVTFNDSLTFHMNGQRVVVFHVAPAHTDGDAIVWFPDADVIHMGDCLFTGRYPVIDVGAGGSIDGMIAAAERVLPRIGDRTRVIPGHGPLGDKTSLQAFHDMLVAARDKIRPLVDAGKSADEIVAARPTADLDARWGTSSMPPERFVRACVAGMTR